MASVELSAEQVDTIGQKILDLSNLWIATVAFGGIFRPYIVSTRFLTAAICIWVALFMLALAALREANRPAERR